MSILKRRSILDFLLVFIVASEVILILIENLNTLLIARTGGLPGLGNPRAIGRC